MSATHDLFTRWKAHKGVQSDREAAGMLGVSHGTPHHWKNGRNGAPAVIERMAKDLGIDPIPTILQAFAEAANDAADKKTLGRLARSLGAACLALALLPLWLPQRAEAAIKPGLITAPVYTLCAVAHNAIQRLRAWWQDFLESSPCNPRALSLIPQ